MWLVRYALAKPHSIGALALLILLLGFLSYRSLPVDILPDVDIPSIRIIWIYKGLNASEMATKITSFSELTIMNSVDNVREVRSQTMNGVAIINVDFQPSVDIELALAQTTGVSQTILKRLPAGITPPLITQYSQSSTPILQLVMTSNSLTDSQLSDFARLQLRSSIQSIAGIRLSLPYGGANRQVMVDIRPDALLAYGLTPSDINNTLNRQNLTLPSGNIREQKQDMQISIDASPQTIEEFKTLPVKAVGDKLVLLRDVAEVRDGPALQTNIARVNGQNAIVVSLIKLGNTSTLDIINQVLAKLPEIQRAAPPGLTLVPIFDQSVFVRTALHHIQTEILIVGLLVALVVLLFLGSWRATLIVLISIPLSLLSAIIILKLTGHTLNLMSLGGLALAIGILVDNALVEIENIKRLLANGLPIKEAALESAKQVAFPEFVSTLSTCIVFTPIFLLTGVAGYIFRPLAIVVISALAASYILSRTVVPVLSVMLLPADLRPAKPNFLLRIHNKVEAGVEQIKTHLMRFLNYLLTHSLVMIAIIIAAIALGTLSAAFSGRDFFPKTDAGLMRFYVRVDSGTRVEDTAQSFTDIQRVIRKIIPANELAFVVDIIGTPDPINLGWIDSSSIGSYDGEILIQLQPDHASTASYEKKIRQALTQKFKNLVLIAQPADTTNQTLAGSSLSALDVRFSGRDFTGNLALANQLIAEMKKVKGATDVTLQQVLNLPEYHVSINRERALQLGITTQEIVSSILGALGSGGTVEANYWADDATGSSYTVQAQAPLNKMTSLDNLLNLKVHPSKGGPDISLRSVITITPRLVPASVNRATLQPILNVLINADGVDLGYLYNKTKNIINTLRPHLKPGNQIIIMGQGNAMHNAYVDLLQGFFLALIFIYIIMVFNFQSWIMPLIALSGAPIAISGAIFALLVTQTTISVQALMGFIMVMGVSTANSVLVTSFARNLWLTGESSTIAAKEALSKRLRPVLMTALTMIIGVIPLALALGQGGEQNAPLARAVIGGLTFGTCASLIVVPWFFAKIMASFHHPVLDKPEPPIP